MIAERILIMGLPGSGKTTLANQLVNSLEALGKTVSWFNADKVREQYNDWDFSEEGRIRQSVRMRNLSDGCNTDYAICDFVAPLEQARVNVDPSWVVWMDTIHEGRYADTNKAFIPPSKYDFRLNEFDADKWGKHIAFAIVNHHRRPVFDWTVAAVA
jgi:adenylylsulfate kinase